MISSHPHFIPKTPILRSDTFNFRYSKTFYKTSLTPSKRLPPHTSPLQSQSLRRKSPNRPDHPDHSDHPKLHQKSSQSHYNSQSPGRTHPMTLSRRQIHPVSPSNRKILLQNSKIPELSQTSENFKNSENPEISEKEENSENLGKSKGGEPIQNLDWDEILKPSGEGFQAKSQNFYFGIFLKFTSIANIKLPVSMRGYGKKLPKNVERVQVDITTHQQRNKRFKLALEQF